MAGFTQEKARSLDSGPAKTRLAPFIATMEIAGELGLPGSRHYDITTTGPSTLVPGGCSTAECVYNYAQAGGTFETVIHRGEPQRSALQDIGVGLATVAGTFLAPFFPSAVPSLLQLGRRLNPDVAPRGPAGLADVAPVALTPSTPEVPMFEDFFDDVGGFFDSTVAEYDWGGLLNVGTELAGSYLDYSQTVAARAPKLPPPGGGLMPSMPFLGGGLAAASKTVGRKFFEKFPNLAAGIQKLWNAGHKNITRKRLYQMLKRFGADFLVSAGILTAAAVAELAMAGPGTRRMNPANARALRRSARRIKAFHRLCGHTDLIKTRRRSFGSCGTCKRSPCRCR